MSQTTWNKATVESGTDPWNLVPDNKKAVETLNTVVTVASAAERDGLTPPGGKYVGMIVDRTDTGRYERWNGSAWRYAHSARLGLHRQAAVTIATATYATLCTVTATHNGGPVEISYTGLLANGNSGADRTADVQILRDGSVVSGITYSLPLIAGTDAYYTVAFAFDSTAAAGSHTWELQTRGSISGAVINQQMTLKITEHPA